MRKLTGKSCFRSGLIKTKGKSRIPILSRYDKYNDILYIYTSYYTRGRNLYLHRILPSLSPHSVLILIHGVVSQLSHCLAISAIQNHKINRYGVCPAWAILGLVRQLLILSYEVFVIPFSVPAVHTHC